MWLPSADQTGKAFNGELYVNREFAPRTRSYSQISKMPVCGSPRVVATELPLGEMEAPNNSPGGPTVPLIFPDRSNQVSCELPDVLDATREWETSTPFSEVEKYARR